MGNQKQQKQPAPQLKAFGKEWCLQGTFVDANELAQNKANWLKLGHKAIIKYSNVLYVTRFKQ